ncbi:MAG: hypothetical protein H0U19_15530 [Acidobacteria bacterium]|nr:hypothetical protein [Acidobacteriota bacterium]
MGRRVTAGLARGVRFTHIVDRAYRRFDRLRSALVVAFASDRFFDEYNALAYGVTATYRPDSADFRRGLFDWEEQAVGRFFPPPPARVLVGGAGGGREAFALLDKGYTVVAFDPAEALVQAMSSQNPSGSRLRAYCGDYGTLPVLAGPSGQPGVNLRDELPFDAAVVGWASFSHLRNDHERVRTLQRFAELTRGPILVSYFADPASSKVSPPVGGVKGWVKRRLARRGTSVFSVQIGYYRLLGHEEMDDLVSRSGLNVLGTDRNANWPYLVVAGVGHD